MEPAQSAEAPLARPPVRDVPVAAGPLVAMEPPRTVAEPKAPVVAAEPPPPTNHAPVEPVGLLGDLPDATLRSVLLHAPIKEVEKGRGGRSLGFKITLEGGQKAYFKAEQTFSAANWYAEVAAYHLDRMLGFGRVPTVVSREFDWAVLEPCATRDLRKSEVIVQDGKVRGAFVAWVKGGLQSMPEQQGWERWVRVKYWPSTAISPFQRPAVWKHQLDQVRKLGDDYRTKSDRQRRRQLRPEPDRDDRPAELSDLIVFDYLIKNLDRWGGANANVLIRGERGPLIFLDNGAGFEPGDARPSLIEARLHTLQRFRRSTIAAVRALDLARFRERVRAEPVQPVLNEAQFQGLAERREALLAWVEEMQRTYGEAIWAWE